MKININIKAELMLASVAIFWGVTFLMMQDAIETVPVYSFLFYRFFLAFVIMFIISYKKTKVLRPKDLFYGLVLGVILFFSYASQTFALLYTQSTVVAFLTGLMVVFVPFFSYILFRQHIPTKVIVASIIASIGLYYLTMNSSLEFGLGEALAIFCAVLFALHLLYTDIFSKKCEIFVVVTAQLFVVALLSMLFSLIFEQKTFDIPMSQTFFIALIVTSVFATAYAFLVQTYMQKFVTASKTVIIFVLEPLSAAFYGMFVGGEVFLFWQIIGAGLIILATIISQI
ncbi:MAG: EamA family transporter [Campylobacteraceae bacterium 4484_166]|nr:MAG: EamA family transporter [Campylobacteraceae bacterium 4484_166]